MNTRHSSSRPFKSRYFGVSSLYMKIRSKVWIAIVIRVNPKTILQCSNYELNWMRINWKTKAKNTPKAMKIWLKAPNIPHISLGEYYLIKRGIMALYNPMQAPWRNRITKKTYKFGISTIIPQINAITLVNITEFLY